MKLCHREESIVNREEELKGYDVIPLKVLADNLINQIDKSTVIQLILHMEESINDGHAF